MQWLQCGITSIEGRPCKHIIIICGRYRERERERLMPATWSHFLLFLHSTWSEKRKRYASGESRDKTKANIFFSQKIELTQSYTTTAKVPLSGTEAAPIFQLHWIPSFFSLLIPCRYQKVHLVFGNLCPATPVHPQQKQQSLLYEALLKKWYQTIL